MNNIISDKNHMIEVFRAMLSAIDTKKKKSVNIETIHRFVNPEYKHTVLDTSSYMSSLIETGYIRYRDYLEKRYYNASKLGLERWNTYLGASLHELMDEAERRTQARESERPPWEQERKEA